MRHIKTWELYESHHSTAGEKKSNEFVCGNFVYTKKEISELIQKAVNCTVYSDECADAFAAALGSELCNDYVKCIHDAVTASGWTSGSVLFDHIVQEATTSFVAERDELKAISKKYNSNDDH